MEAPGRNAEKIMTDLEKSYEQARVQTHKARGVGLGFGEAAGSFMHHQAGYGEQGGRPGVGPAPPAWGLQPGGGGGQQPPAAVRGGHINFVKKS